MRLLITGGAGFIGANLARRLVQSNEVVVLDDFSTGQRSNLEGLDVEVVEGSILDDAAMMRAVSSVGAIVHLAARPSVPRSLQDPIASHEANATGTVRVLEAARNNGIGHVVVASSSSVYGSNSILPKREDLAPRPLSPYAASKLASESYALAYANSFGLHVLALRFFNVYGPLQMPGHAYAAVVPAFISAALEGRPVQIHGDGCQTRDFTFVDSVTAIIADAIARRVYSDLPVNLAFGTRISLLELLTEIEAVIGCRIDRYHVATRPGDVRDSQAANDRLVGLFSAIKPVELREGLAATVAWFEGRGSK